MLDRIVLTARPWFEQHLPEQLLAPGPRGLLWWQWLAVPVAALVAYAAGKALGWVSRRLLGVLFARTKTTWDDLFLERLGPPLTALWSFAVAYALLPWLALSDATRGAVERGLHAGTFVVFFWAALRAVDVGFQFLGSWPWARANPLAAGFLPLGSKIARVAVAVMGAIAVLTQLGYPAASLLAGLGIGGLALALAAQKTVENLFGSVSISVDQPCRVGDFVKVEGVAGNVESIGLRSTRIRTLDRTLVTIPNGKLADSRIETFAARDRIRFTMMLGLVYGTTAAQMREVVAGVEKLLAAEKLHEPPVVRFVAMSPSSLDVEVVAVFATSDWNEFAATRQDLLLGFMEVVERAGTELAFPTQTVHLASIPAPLKGEGPVGRPGLRVGGADRDRTDDL